MATFKIDSSEFDEPIYYLIAIHSRIEMYRLAFFINQNININLFRSAQDLNFSTKKGMAHFMHFEFEDKEKDLKFDLIQNKSNIEISSNLAQNDLFATTQNSFFIPTYLMPDFKKVDFFLKIEVNESPLDLDEMVSKIKLIPEVSTVYAIDSNTIKSKYNLIF